MLKKLRWRFITVAMIAFSTVIIALLLIINISTYSSITHQQDETLQLLTKMETDRKVPFSPDGFPTPPSHRDFSSEFQYMIRFFAVMCVPQFCVYSARGQAPRYSSRQRPDSRISCATSKPT